MDEMSNDLTLVVLAAGVGSRFGGLKQLVGVGTNGETLLEYSIFDALRAGFTRVVLVVRRETEAAFHETLGVRLAGHAELSYVHQRLDQLPAGWQPPRGRSKPWGTGQAVLACADVVTGPFAIINADDFYGARAFAAVADFLRQDDSGTIPAYAMVGFGLLDTLPDTGSVSRALCRCDDEGWLQSIVEITALERSGSGGRYTDADGLTYHLGSDELVSMNLWGFTPALFAELEQHFIRFLEEQRGSPDAEHRLPDLIQDLITTGKARVKVLPSGDQWCGVTYREDHALVTARLQELVAAGAYPAVLWC
jgi:dTDP-glucose pyrophosphorylase